MTDTDKPKPDDEVDAVLDDIKKPDPSRNPADDIAEQGAPDGGDFA